MKITIPNSSILVGGNLETWYLNTTRVNNTLSITPNNGDMIINDANTSFKIILNQAELLAILAEGGEVEEAVFGIRCPNTLANQSVPVSLPYHTNILGDVDLFKNWFGEGSEVWREDAGDEFIFYNNPIGRNAALSDYLKGSQIEIIRQLDGVNITILAVAEVAAVVSSGWTKVIW